MRKKTFYKKLLFGMVLVSLFFSLSFFSPAQAVEMREEITIGSAFTFSLEEQHPTAESTDTSSQNSNCASSGTTAIVSTGDYRIPFSIVIAAICVSSCALVVFNKKANKIRL